MKSSIHFLIFASAFVAGALAKPARVGFFGCCDQDEQPVIIMSNGDETSSGLMFHNWYSSLRDAMNSVKDQLFKTLVAAEEQSAFVPDFFNPPKGANTTSTVKVVDGHVVTVNETTYTDGDDTSGTVIHTRIVEIHPENSENTDTVGSSEVELVAATTTEKPASTSDTIENFAENEIARSAKTESVA